MYLSDNSIDLIITDPPYGIEGHTLHKHYNRKEEHVLDGYIEIPREEYPMFSEKWIKEAERVLRPGGSIYIFSGYTNLIHILSAVQKTNLKEVNHIIWKYNFGVYTKNKYISSHYHILYYVKPGAKPTFNTNCRFSDAEKDESGRSLNYRDREDVWIINREYKPGQVKNKNELPKELLMKIIQYSSNEGDLICDFFLGSFSTARVAIGLNRRACGFEKSKVAFDYGMSIISKLTPGYLLSEIRIPKENTYFNQGKSISEEEKKKIIRTYVHLRRRFSKEKAIELLSAEFGRGPWSIRRIISEVNSCENFNLFLPNTS